MSITQAKYAVIFTSQRTFGNQMSYEAMSEKMLNLVKGMEGFVKADSLRNADGFGITISYWTSLESIKNWKSEAEHTKAQELGKSLWYSSYTTKICRIEEEYSFPEIKTGSSKVI